MKYRSLSADLAVSSIGLGCMGHDLGMRHLRRGGDTAPSLLAALARGAAPVQHSPRWLSDTGTPLPMTR
jgi:hypothetical protein